MKLETKANVGDEVYFMHDNKIALAKVKYIDIRIEHENLTNCETVMTVYGFTGYILGSLQELKVTELLVFKTRQELLESL